MSPAVRRSLHLPRRVVKYCQKLRTQRKRLKRQVQKLAHRKCFFMGAVSPLPKILNTPYTSQHPCSLSLTCITPFTLRDQLRQRNNGDSLASGVGPKSRPLWRSVWAAPQGSARGPLATPSPGALLLFVLPRRFGRNCPPADVHTHSCLPSFFIKFFFSCLLRTLFCEWCITALAAHALGLRTRGPEFQTCYQQ